MAFKNPTGYWHHQGTYIIEVMQSQAFVNDRDISNELAKRGITMEVRNGFIYLEVKDGMFQRSNTNFNFYNKDDHAHMFVVPDKYISSILRADDTLLWENQQLGV